MKNTINPMNSSNLFEKNRLRATRIGKLTNLPYWKTGQNPTGTFKRRLFPEGDIKNILFLSKRGMSRAPVAREVMRSILEKTHLFGKVAVFSAGSIEAYDDCPTDGRIKQFCKELGYNLQANSAFATPEILNKSDVIITLDHESAEFARVNHRVIKAQVRPLGVFMQPGSNPYVIDPYDRGDELSAEECYDEIISTIEYGCVKLSADLPSFFA